MEKQRTLKNSFSLEGKGLHMGVSTCITFHPAAENHGYKIRRTDMEGQPVIDALAENVVATNRGTVLEQNGARVSTVEHVLAALYACVVDNCLIDVNGPEFPILDGSSILYVSKIKETGLELQSAERKYINLKKKKIKVADKETGSSMMLLPDESFNVTSSITFNSTFLRRQDAQLNALADFTKEIAACRTFVFVREIEGLLKQNLIKGGDMNNAIVIYDKKIEQESFDNLAQSMGIKKRDASKLGYLMAKPLLYTNEPARHKLLDIIGDLALVGYFIKGKVIANCPGHTINNLFARAIREAIGATRKHPVHLETALAAEMC